jgi:hypothetical protein
VEIAGKSQLAVQAQEAANAGERAWFLLVPQLAIHGHWL